MSVGLAVRNRTWRPEDIVVSEVGYYSVYRDPLNGEVLIVREDRTALRKVLHRHEPDTAVPYDHTFQPVPQEENDELSARPNRLEQMSCLNRWLGLRAQNADMQSYWNQVEFVATNRVLSQIMKIPYRVDWHNTNQWAFGAARVDGKIYIGYIRRDGFIDLSKEVPVTEPEQQQGEPSWYRNQQFDEISCGTTLSPSAQYHSVVLTSFGGMGLLIDSTVDAEDDNGEFLEYPGKYVSLQLVRNVVRSNLQHSIWSRMCRWWTTDALNGVGVLRLGVNGDPDGANSNVLKLIQIYRIKDLPERVDAPENHENCISPRNCRRQAVKWNPHVCLSFLHLVLQLVKEKVVLDSTKMVYEFHGRRDLLHFTRICDLNSVIVHEVPAERARDLGHNYLPYGPRFDHDGST